MSTPYSDIFKKYSILVTDSELLSVLDDEEYTELLELFLSKSKSIYFKSCSKNLSDVDIAAQKFNQTLTEEEMWLLAECMKLVWYEKQLFKENNLRDKIGSKDYSRHSPGNLLDKLIMLKKDTEKSLKDKIVDYSFNEFSGFN